MSRGLLTILILILLLAGGIFYLSTSAKEVPQETIETDVMSNDAAQ